MSETPKPLEEVTVEIVGVWNPEDDPEFAEELARAYGIEPDAPVVGGAVAIRTAAVTVRRQQADDPAGPWEDVGAGGETKRYVRDLLTAVGDVPGGVPVTLVPDADTPHVVGEA